MAQRNQSRVVTPVRAATFLDGPDSLLLNPDVVRARWHVERVRAALRPGVVIGVLGGAAGTVVAVTAEMGLAMVCAGVLLTGLSVMVGWERAAGMLAEHDHAASACRLERRRGEFFFRSRDFAGLGAAGAVVRDVIAGVDELHRSPAHAWIGPAVPREVHLVVWQALEFLDRTRTARSLAADLAADPGSAVGELGATARAAVAEIDEALDEVARHVHGCLVLTRAWEAKLRDGELAARTETALAALPGRRDAKNLAAAAEALPQTVFAYVTAARDTAAAGEFPWEQPRSSWPHPHWATAARSDTAPVNAVPVNASPKRTRRTGRPQ